MDTHGVRLPQVKNGWCKAIIHKTSFGLNIGDVYTSHGPVIPPSTTYSFYLASNISLRRPNVFSNTWNLSCSEVTSKFASLLRSHNPTQHEVEIPPNSIVRYLNTRQLQCNGKVRVRTLYYTKEGQRGNSGNVRWPSTRRVGRSLESRYVWERGGGGGRANEQLRFVLHCVASCPNIQTAVLNIQQDARI